MTFLPADAASTVNNGTGEMPQHRWISLETMAEVEAWMELNNHELQQKIGNQPGSGHGICFSLAHGGELFLHTNSDGDVLLDVTPEAQWISPVLSAITASAVPRGQIWILPNNILLQLILGLNSLIASSRLVLKHNYKC